jgi:mono/diheme cytochrome c family protein
MSATSGARRKRIAARVLAIALALLALAVAALVALGEHDDDAFAHRAPPSLADATLRARGAYLARVGNCAGCHSVRGGAPYAGGLGIATPFGTVYASNLTPDGATGLGRWSADDFWRALHLGRSRDGHLLTPAFPYPNFSAVTRDDSDALYAFLRTLPAVHQPTPASTLRWPYRTQAALAVWRGLYFRPAVFAPDATRSAEWNRGAYLVRGLGHCSACHAPRNWLGASAADRTLPGGLIPLQNWSAPALAWAPGAVAAEELQALLRDGQTAHRAVLGPMAEVVFESTQYLQTGDLAAIAAYLQALPAAPVRRTHAEAAAAAADADLLRQGQAVYRKACADCHGAQGQGAARAYPPLAGNATVIAAQPINLLRVIAEGGFAPVTAGNPRPYGMPPFAERLSQREIAAVASYVRQAWGNDAGAVSELDVLAVR